MRQKAFVILLALAMTVPVGLVGSPAAAQPSGDTIVTFTVATADLVIEVPGSVNLGSGFPGARISGQLGNVRVVDGRAALAANWVATVTASDFTTNGGLPAQTIPHDNSYYWSGPVVTSTGVGTFVPGQPTEADEVNLNLPRVAFSKTSGSGDNSATWNPTVSVQIPPTAVGGLYVGRVTHSVA